MSSIAPETAPQPEEATATAETPRQRRNLDTLRHDRIARSIERLVNAKSGYKVPWDALHRQIRTLVAGDILTLGAYTGAGKTTMGLNIVSGLARAGVQVLYFGTEQSDDELGFKLACMELGVPYGDARRGELSPEWTARVRQRIVAQGEGTGANISYYPGSNPSGDEVLIAIDASAKRGVEVFVLDYLGHIELPGYGPAHERTRVFMAKLKALAVERKVVIILCVQVGKAEGSVGQMLRHTKPELSQIQGGSAVVQESDVVLGIYQPLRPGVTNEEKAMVRSGAKHLDDIVERDTAAVVLLKYREGSPPSPIGSVSTYWVRHNRFHERPKEQAEMPTVLTNSEYDQERGREFKQSAEVFPPDSR